MKLPHLLAGSRGGRVRGGRARQGALNLARRPFVNQRPVLRAALLLALAGLVLLALNVWLYTSYVTTRRANATELDRIEQQIAEERGRIARAEGELGSADLARQNQLVEYLNERIAERTFGWSVLFDRLAAILPRDVRLVSLSPSAARDARSRRATESDSESRVQLAIVGRARSGEAVLELLDALFADPAFENPNLAQESQQAGEIAFQMSVVYHPSRAAALAEPVTAEPAGEAE
ncbi:MAG TPA: PilN domain-containing protein [Thermoanaerobaculia bacterium]|nr:PilN domain-containing protein [Thermoanaerobaculia bacterium]